jgi:hypothetical protein
MEGSLAQSNKQAAEGQAETQKGSQGVEIFTRINQPFTNRLKHNPAVGNCTKIYFTRKYLGK